MNLGLYKNLTFNSGMPWPYATGGDYVYLYEDTTTGKTYRVHEFLSTGTSTLNVEVGGQMDILVVGGGGSGGVDTYATTSGAGGGAGKFLEYSGKISAGTHTVTVGSGGPAVTRTTGNTPADPGPRGKNGNPSSFVTTTLTLTATGGGGGGGGYWGASNTDRTRFYPGLSGGCGGGAAGLSNTIGLADSYTGDGTAYGNNGGAGSAQRHGGGGGGANSNGGNATTTNGGNGGAGRQWLNGNYYAGGGGGGAVGSAGSVAGSGGIGGGGAGSLGSSATSASPNTGGGGGGAGGVGDPGTATSGAGGSGIVIVRYVVAEKKLWTPSELTSLKAWWDAADETTIFDATSGGSLPNSGNDIARWEDKSGGGYHVTQATAANCPHYVTNMLNNKSIVEFSSQWLTAQTASDWNFLHNLGGSTVILVCKAGNSANPNIAGVFLGNAAASQLTHGYQFAFDDRASASRNDRLSHNITRGVSPNTINNVSGDNVFTANNFGIVAVVSDPGNATGSARSKVIVNSGSPIQNNTETAAASTANATYPIDIGADGNGIFPLTGAIAEIIICNAVVTVTDRQKLEGYLAHKWGLTNNLPSGHPYKYEPPYKVEPEEIVTENLVFNVDSGDYASYPRKGTTWYDLSGNGNHMTLYNPTYYTYDSESNSLDFSRNTSLNTGGYAEKTSPTGAISSQTTFFAGDHSVEIWARLNDIQPTFYYNNSLTTETYNALFLYRGSHTMFFSNATNLFYSLVYPSNVYTGVNAPVISDYNLQGKWFHSIAVKSGSTLYMYVNGVLVSTRKLTSNTFRTESPVNLRISTGNAGSGSNFWRWYTESNVSAARMYTKALSSTEVTQNFNALKNRYGTASLSEPSGTVTNNLIVHLDAGNSSSYSGSGSTWTDLSGSGNNATLYNTPTYSSSNGGHLSFDGTNEYAEISASASTNLSSSSITVSAWAKSSTSTWSAYWSLVSKYSQFILGPNGQNEIAFLVYTSGGWQPTTYNNAIWGQSGTGFDNTQWHNYVGVYNSSANLTQLYIDGIAVAEVAISGSVSSDTGPIHLMHRELDAAGTNHLAGSLSNVQIYNRALSSYEVLKNFNALRGRYGI